MEETLLCPICGELPNNPLLITVCGHTFCALCIQKHLDNVINTTTNDQCPQCRKKCATHNLTHNITMANAIAAYKALRSDLLSELTRNDSRGNGSSSGINSSSTGGFGARGGTKIGTKKLAMMNFHQMPKNKVKAALENLCPKNCQPILYGERGDMIRVYREIVHLHNAQIGSTEPLTFDAVVNEVNKKERVRRSEASKGARAKADYDSVTAQLAEGSHPHKLSDSMVKGFHVLTQKMREDKLKAAVAAAAITAGSSSSSSSSSNSGGMSLSDERVPGEYTWGDWRVAFSEKLGRPFFWNQVTNVGQFAIPLELEATMIRLQEESEGVGGGDGADEEVEKVVDVVDLCEEDDKMDVAVSGGHGPQVAATNATTNATAPAFGPLLSQKRRGREGRRSSSSTVSVDAAGTEGGGESAPLTVDVDEPLSESIPSSQCSGGPSKGSGGDSGRREKKRNRAGRDVLTQLDSNAGGKRMRGEVVRGPLCSSDSGGCDDSLECSDPFRESDNDLSNGFREVPSTATQVDEETQPPHDHQQEADTWNCAFCTFANENDRFDCSMCGKSSSHRGRRSQRGTQSSTQQNAFSVMTASHNKSSASKAKPMHSSSRRSR